MDRPSAPDAPPELVQRLAELNQIGIALSQEKNLDRLLESILVAAQRLTRAEAGTLYRRDADASDHLRFEIMRNDRLRIAYGGTSGRPVQLSPLALHHQDGRPNESMVVAHAVLNDRTVEIADAYEEKRFDFSGTKAIDRQTGYRSRSILCVPLKNHEGDIIGALQLINALDPQTGEVTRFSATDVHLVESLASQAAVALTNRLLILQLEELFEAFIDVINKAIDEKSVYTAGHCQRVPVLTMLLADAAHATARGPLASWEMSERDRHELRLAALLHDCGKVTTPVHIVDKATKLQTIHDRIELIATRFAAIKAELEHAQTRQPSDHTAAKLARLDADLAFLRTCNRGTETMSRADQERVRGIAQTYTWRDMDGRVQPALTEEEIASLTIPQGTLTAEERRVINHHVTVTIKMLEALPWPKHLQRVTEYAGAHHERIDGKGYPRGLKGDALSIPARIMAIADIFEALTARDRPYKEGKTLSEALTILGRLSAEGAIDADLFDLFVRDRVFLRYAQEHMDPRQIDEVDVTRLPGYRGD